MRVNSERLIGRSYCRRDMSIKDRLEHVGWTKRPTGCWEWNGGKHVSGYGVLNIYGRSHYAHREALQIKLGRPLTPGMYACHTCDNPPCMNPDHLFEGDHRDNMADMRSKGRGHGGRHGGTPRYKPEHFETVYAMRGRPLAEISAAAGGMSHQYISLLLSGAKQPPAAYAGLIRGERSLA